MTNEEILNKAINKAISNGLKLERMPETEAEAISIILTEDFAKAFFGTEKAMRQVSGTVDGETRTAWRSDQCAWEVHMEQMKGNPVEYLGSILANE